MKSKLDLLEQYLRRLIETSADLIWRDERIDLVRNMIQAIETEMGITAEDRDALPSVYSIQLAPAKYALWHADKDLIDSISMALEEAAAEVGLRLNGRPVISLEVSAALHENEMRVHILYSEHAAQKTSIFSNDTSENARIKADSELHAFLILEDGTHFSLGKSVINIGRREENELIIDDPHVSREHAQIRLVQNAYFLFDLNSTAGTYVNGRKIDRYVLQPGDVISFSGHPVIYAREEDPEKKTGAAKTDITHTTRINLDKGGEKKKE